MRSRSILLTTVFLYPFLGDLLMKLRFKGVVTPGANVLRRYWVPCLGLAAAGLAFYATQQYAEQRVAQERIRLLPAGGLMEVIVAARDLVPGDVVTAATVAVRQIPRQWAVSDAVNSLEFDSIHQLSLTRAAKAGQPITLDHLRQAKSSASGLKLESGFRAVSIAVDEVSSVGGLIQPGDRVDLWAHAQPIASQDASGMVQITTETAGPPKRARLVAENLKVVATGSRTERSAQSTADGAPGTLAYSSITLAVPEHIAAMVLGGQFQGRLGIALRAESLATPVTEPTQLSAKRTKPAKEVTAGPVEILVGGLEGGTP